MKTCTKILILLALILGGYWAFQTKVATPQPLSPAAVSPQRNTAAAVESSPAAAPSTEPEANDETPASAAKWQFAAMFGKEEKPALAAFSKWTADYLAASPSERVAMEAKGIELAAARRDAYKELIQSNPKMALDQTVPAALRAVLPATISGLLEERISSRGDYLVLGTTAKAGSGAPAGIRRLVNFDGRYLTANVFGSRVSQRATENISLHGVALDDQLALSESPIRVLEPGEPAPNKPLAADSCPVSGKATADGSVGRPGAIGLETGDHVYWLCSAGHIAPTEEAVKGDEAPIAKLYRTTGSRSIVVIMVDFSDATGGAVSQSVAQTRLTDVCAFLRANSYNQLSFDRQVVTPVLRMPRTGSSYSGSGNGDMDLLADARSRAAAAGFDHNTFDFDVVVFPDIGFFWSGQGFVGNRGSWVQEFPEGTTAHELGHNLGLWHANSWVSSGISDIGGTHDEYGNVFSVMGFSSAFPNNHFTANGKFVLEWLPAARVRTVTASGSYRVYAFDNTDALAADRFYALKIPAGLLRDGVMEDYWVDYRQLLRDRYPSSANGALVQWGDDSGEKNADRLLDMTPNTTTMEDAPLRVGRNFADAESNITIVAAAQGGTGADAYMDLQISLVPIPTIELPEALDNASITWGNTGAPWVGTAVVSHDGVDAAASGSIGHNGSSSLTATLVGPGTLTFWMKVSSESGYDFGTFTLDTSVHVSRSGNADWERHTINVPAGSHQAVWRYFKDGSVVEGSDRAWVDEVSFLPVGESAPNITQHPLSQTVSLGQSVTFSVQATGSTPLSYQWRKGPNPIQNANGPTFNIPSAQETDAGQYTVVVTNPLGSATSNPATLTVGGGGGGTTLADAVDLPGLLFTTAGAVWTHQTTITHDGADAAQSGAIDHGGASSFETIVTGPADVSFWWKVSSEGNFDYLNFVVGNTLVQAISGEVNWVRFTHSLPAGEHTLRWIYSKDGSVVVGSDRAWVDQIEIGNVTPPTSPLADALDVPGRQITTGAAAWTRQTAVTHDGVDAAQSAAIGHGGSSVMETRVTGPTEVRFWWKVSSEVDFDFLDFKVDGQFESWISGAVDWTEYVYQVPPGEHTLQWIYSKDDSVVVGSDRGWVDQLRIGGGGDPVDPNVADALDTLGATWTYVGPAWSRQTAVTHDGVDAAVSGTIGHNGFSATETIVVGPADVTFWWKVSSEVNFDYVEAWVDNVLAHYMSGEVDWTQQSLSIPEGQHTLRFVYRKDGSVVVGQDRGWVDQVVIQSDTAVAPEITQHPLAISGALGGSVQLSVAATGTAPMAYVWKKGGVALTGSARIVGVDGATLTINALENGDAGDYSVSISNPAGVANSNPAIVSIVGAGGLGEAVDFTSVTWSAGGNASWASQSAASHDGIDAARSGVIGDGGQSWFEATVQGPGELSFWWKVSSEAGYDFLHFIVDGVTVNLISGEQNWAQFNHQLPSGAHIIRFMYRKDGSLVRGDDSAWIDQLTLSTQPPEELRFSATALIGGSLNTLIAGIPAGANLVVEATADLAAGNWTRVEPGPLNGSTRSLSRPAGTGREFLRMRIDGPGGAVAPPALSRITLTYNSGPFAGSTSSPVLASGGSFTVPNENLQGTYTYSPSGSSAALNLIYGGDIVGDRDNLQLTFQTSSSGTFTGTVLVIGQTHSVTGTFAAVAQ